MNTPTTKWRPGRGETETGKIKETQRRQLLSYSVTVLLLDYGTTTVLLITTVLYYCSTGPQAT